MGVDLKYKSKKVETILNRLTVATPAFIPPAALKKRLEKQERKMEEDDEEEDMETSVPKRKSRGSWSWSREMTTSWTFRRTLIFPRIRSTTLSLRPGRDTTLPTLSIPTSWRSWRLSSERKKLGRRLVSTTLRSPRRTRAMPR